MLVMSQRVELMRCPALSAWRTLAAMSAWKHGSTGRSTSWPAQDSGLWHGSMPDENRPPRREVGDGPRLRRLRELFLRVRVCIAMLWCLRRDSNPHARRQRLLRSRCLPIPPRRRGAPRCSNSWGASTPTGIRTQDLVLIRHDTRYKLAALTAELWGRGRDAGGVEEADAASTGGARQRGSRLPQMAAASVVVPIVFRRRPGMWTAWAASTSSGLRNPRPCR